MSPSRVWKRLTQAAAPGGFVEGERGTWTPTHIDGRLSAVAFCPSCGQRGTLDSHAIDADGSATPSLVCPRDGCSYHEFVRLMGWLPEPAP